MSDTSFTPLSKAKISRYSLLRLLKNRRKESLFIVEGKKSIQDLLPYFEIIDIVGTPGVLKDLEIPVKYQTMIHQVSENDFKKISTLSTPQGILAVFKIPDEKTIEIDPKQIYLILDGIQDPGNMGTIIRTADWFGISTIFASYDTVDKYNVKTVQATMGSLGRVDVIYCDLIKLLEENSELEVYGLQLDGKNIYEASFKSAGFIVMGNEGNGISNKIRKYITDAFVIPPFPSARLGTEQCCDSLNVAVATAITLSEFRHNNGK